MVTISLGNKKKSFKSVKEAAIAAGIPYMTLYMRLRMGVKASKAINQPVRPYRKQQQAA